jgi:hypothetical protein
MAHLHRNTYAFNTETQLTIVHLVGEIKLSKLHKIACRNSVPNVTYTSSLLIPFPKAAITFQRDSDLNLAATAYAC